MKRFPTFAVIVLFFAIIWLLNSFGVGINVPWLPVLLVLIAVGWIINHYARV